MGKCCTWVVPKSAFVIFGSVYRCSWGMEDVVGLGGTSHPPPPPQCNCVCSWCAGRALLLLLSMLYGIPTLILFIHVEGKTQMPSRPQSPSRLVPRGSTAGDVGRPQSTTTTTTTHTQWPCGHDPALVMAGPTTKQHTNTRPAPRNNRRTPVVCPCVPTTAATEA